MFLSPWVIQFIIGCIIVAICAIGGVYGGYMIKDSLEKKRTHLNIDQSKPDLDLHIYNYGKKISLSKSKNQDPVVFSFEPVIENIGKGVARYISLHIKFPNILEVTYNKNTWALYRKSNFNILEYNGGINNIVHVGSQMGLRDLIIKLPNNFVGVLDIPFWIICENMAKKEGKLTIEVK